MVDESKSNHGYDPWISNELQVSGLRGPKQPSGEKILLLEEYKTYRTRNKVTLIVIGICLFLSGLYALGVVPAREAESLLFCITISLMFLHSRAPAIGIPVRFGNASVRWIFYSTIAASVILLGIYVSSSFAIYTEIVSWPHIGSMAHIPFSILCCAICFHLLFLLFSIIDRELPFRRKAIRLSSIFLGILLAVSVARDAQTIARRSFEAAYQPLVDLVKSNPHDPCNPPVAYYDNELLKGLRKVGTLRYDKKDFVLLFEAGSADIDGSYIYYSSKMEKWAMFHGDSRTGWEYLWELSEGMAKCPIR